MEEEYSEKRTAQARGPLLMLLGGAAGGTVAGLLFGALFGVSSELFGAGFGGALLGSLYGALVGALNGAFCGIVAWVVSTFTPVRLDAAWIGAILAALSLFIPGILGIALGWPMVWATAAVLTGAMAGGMIEVLRPTDQEPSGA